MNTSVPKTWQIKKLGEIAEIFNGKTAPKDLYTQSGIPIVKVKNVTGVGLQFDDLEYVPEDFYLKNKKATIISGDILIVNAAHRPEYIGRCDLVNQLPKNAEHVHWMAVGELMVVRADSNKMHPLILESIFKTSRFRKQMISLANPSTPHLYPKDMKRLPVPIPPMEIQREIVERLDAIRKAQQLNDKQIALAEELFQSLLHRELDPTRSTSSGQEGKNWEVKRLGEVAYITSGGTPSRKKPEYFEGEIPWVKSGELKDDEIYQTEECISEEGFKNSSAKLFPVNAILIAMYGATVGKTGILKVPATTNQAISSIQVNLKIADFNFIYLILRTKIDFLLRRRFGGAQPNINQSVIKNLKIPIPPLETQGKIVQKLQAAQDYKKSLLAQKEKLKELFESTLDKSMKG